MRRCQDEDSNGRDAGRVEASLQESEARQAFLLRLSDRLRPLADAIEIQYEAARILGEFLGANRVGYGEDQGDSRTIIVTRHYVDGVPPIEGMYHYDDYDPGILHEFQAGRTVIRPDVAKDPRLTTAEKEAHAALQLAAMVDVPLLKDGKLVAILFVHKVEAHHWTPSEVSLMEETAERTWAALIRARAEEDLRKSETWLASQKEAFEAAVNGAPLETSLGILVRTIVAQEGFDVRCAFYAADHANAQLHHIVGMPEPYAEYIESFKIGPDMLACGRAVFLGQPVITPDVTKEARWKPWLWLAERYEVRASWSFPIETSSGKIVGTFAMYFKEPREATPRDYETYAVLTRGAAIIISRSQEAEERIRAEEATRAALDAVAQANEDLERRVQERTAELAEMNLMRQELLRKVVTAQEEERGRISRNLHDDTGQLMTVLLLGLNNVKASLAETADASVLAQLTQLQSVAGEVAQKSHRLSFTLRPTVLDDIGLWGALTNYVQEWKRWSGLPVELANIGIEDHRLPLEIETTIYRIVQETLTNILKHAVAHPSNEAKTNTQSQKGSRKRGNRAATRVSILVQRREGEVITVIEDNGPGFDVEAIRNQPPGKRRLGIFGMQERARLAGGTLTVESQPGKGTTVYLRLPTG